MKFRKKPVEIEAYQWFKNGDHPRDFAENETGEGRIVRYFRHPAIPGTDICKGVSRDGKPVGCGRMFHDHGFIDTLEGGHKVCPGDWVITGVQGEMYPCKPDIFKATYDPAE